MTDYFTVIQENKPLKKKDAEGKETKTDCFYYPGFVFHFTVVRDPWPKIQRAFFPAIILGIFLYCTFDLTDDGDYADRIANLSIALLTYMGILDNVRSGLPEISSLTFADKFLLSYIGTSMLPLIKDGKSKKYMWAMHMHEAVMAQKYL